MPDTCDRCTATALYIVERDNATLHFCGHHLRQHVDILLCEGWTVRELMAEVTAYVAA